MYIQNKQGRKKLNTDSVYNSQNICCTNLESKIGKIKSSEIQQC